MSDDDRTKEIQCDEGYYSPGPGASECFACPAGAFAEASVGSAEDLANLAEETTRAVPARGETKDDDALEQPVVITG